LKFGDFCALANLNENAKPVVNRLYCHSWIDADLSQDDLKNKSIARRN
jgi:hypothetical protein